MNVFITGASGWIGSAVTDELLANGHAVTGLARSDSSAAALEAKGASVVRGTLDDTETLADAAKQAEAVVHLAYKHDSMADRDVAGNAEHDAVRAMLDVLAGSGKPFLVASGLVGFAPGQVVTEEDAGPFEGRSSMRGGSENLALSYAEKGVRPVALRFGASVHGTDGDHGFVHYLATVAKERGVSAWIGDGGNQWPAVDRRDAARGVRLALEKAPAGFRAHLVGEQGITTRAIAEALAARLGVPTASVTPEEAEAHFGWITHFFGADAPASSAITQETLGWTPTGTTLLEDIAAGGYDV